MGRQPADRHRREVRVAVAAHRRLQHRRGRTGRDAAQSPALRRHLAAHGARPDLRDHVVGDGDAVGPPSRARPRTALRRRRRDRAARHLGPHARISLGRPDGVGGHLLLDGCRGRRARAHLRAADRALVDSRGTAHVAPGDHDRPAGTRLPRHRHEPGRPSHPSVPPAHPAPVPPARPCRRADERARRPRQRTVRHREHRTGPRGRPWEHRPGQRRLPASLRLRQRRLPASAARRRVRRLPRHRPSPRRELHRPRRPRRAGRERADLAVRRQRRVARIVDVDPRTYGAHRDRRRHRGLHHPARRRHRHRARTPRAASDNQRRLPRAAKPAHGHPRSRRPHARRRRPHAGPARARDGHRGGRRTDAGPHEIAARLPPRPGDERPIRPVGHRRGHGRRIRPGRGRLRHRPADEHRPPPADHRRRLPTAPGRRQPHQQRDQVHPARR